MSRVNDILEDMRKLSAEGHGNLECHAIHGGSGVSYEVDSSSSISEKESGYPEGGELCEKPDGFKYVSFYLD